MSAQELAAGYVQSIAKLCSGDSNRIRALESLRKWGLPNNKWEDWRYTSLKGKLAEHLEPAERSGNELPGMPDWIRPQLTFVDGYLREHTLPADIVLENNRPQLDFPASQGDSFEALNLALSGSVTTLRIPPGRELEAPLVVVHLTSVQAQSRPTLVPRLEVLLGAGSRAVVFEVFTSQEGEHQSIPLTHAHVADGANLEYIKVIMESPQAIHIGKLKGVLERDAGLQNFTFSLSGSLVRNNVEIELRERGAQTGVHGLFTLRGQQHHDHFCVVHHKKEHTYSDQLFKTVLDEQARAFLLAKWWWTKIVLK